MDDSANTNIEVNQKAALGSNTTQIGQQNIIYNVIPPEQAYQLVMDVFNQNFPKLQAIAKETAEKRANEFCQEIIQKITKNGINDFRPFADPDVQYTLYEAQKNYARFGTSEMLNTLAELMTTRIQHDNDFVLKVSINKALEVAPLLSQKQLNYLSLLFICTQAKASDIKTIKDLELRLKTYVAIWGNADFDSRDYLTMLGCLQIGISRPVSDLAGSYHFPYSDVEKICPEEIKKLSGDHILSPIGTVLAITNLETKNGPKLDLARWIH